MSMNPRDPSDMSNMNRNRPPLRSAPPPAAPPRRQGAVADMPNIRRGNEVSTPAAARYPEGRRLVVGRDITLAGQISKCDFLIVEGMVEGMRYEGQSLEVAEGGSFSGGNVEVDNADISGNFEGSMSVKNRLTIRPTGRVSGTIRYGELEVNAGGQLTGDIKVESVRNAMSVMSGIASSFESGESTPSLSDRLAGE